MQLLKLVSRGLLPQDPDTRDRGDPDYLAWEHSLSEDLRARGMKNPIRDG